MANIDELKRLGERFPNKNIGCGNPNAKILVVTQKERKISKKTIWRFPWSERQVHGCSHLLLLRGVRRGFTEGSLL